MQLGNRRRADAARPTMKRLHQPKLVKEKVVRRGGGVRQVVHAGHAGSALRPRDDVGHQLGVDAAHRCAAWYGRTRTTRRSAACSSQSTRTSRANASARASTASRRQYAAARGGRRSRSGPRSSTATARASRLISGRAARGRWRRRRSRWRADAAISGSSGKTAEAAPSRAGSCSSLWQRATVAYAGAGRATRWCVVASTRQTRARARAKLGREVPARRSRGWA